MDFNNLTPKQQKNIKRALRFVLSLFPPDNQKLQGYEITVEKDTCSLLLKVWNENKTGVNNVVLSVNRNDNDE